VVASGTSRDGPVFFAVERGGSIRPIAESCSSVCSMSASGGVLTLRSGDTPGDSGHRYSANACRVRAQPSATRIRDSRIGSLGVDDATSHNAPASVTSRSTSVMAVASISWRCRAQAFVSESALEQGQWP
jgi:hypothetical protein